MHDAFEARETSRAPPLPVAMFPVRAAFDINTVGVHTPLMKPFDPSREDITPAWGLEAEHWMATAPPPVGIPPTETMAEQDVFDAEGFAQLPADEDVTKTELNLMATSSPGWAPTSIKIAPPCKPAIVLDEVKEENVTCPPEGGTVGIVIETQPPPPLPAVAL